MNQPEGKIILTAEETGRALTRISHEIIEKNPDISSIVIVGIHTRGVPISQRLAKKISEIASVDVPVGEIDTTFYRDDISQKGAALNAAKTNIPADLADKTVILVDDVLFTGRSIRAAVEHLIDYGRPARIQLAVLLDRGHRELPIRADFVGKNIPTSRSQQVRVLIEEIDGRDGALLMEGDSE